MLVRIKLAVTVCEVLAGMEFATTVIANHTWPCNQYSDGVAAPQVVCSMQRPTGTTNQRIGFSIEACGRHLATGGSDGCVRVGPHSTSRTHHTCC